MVVGFTTTYAIVCMFADDTKLYREIANQSDIKIIQNDINNLFKWSEKWLFALSS
jgi:hypothetical protein